MAGRYDLEKPNPLWKHLPKWATADSEKMTWNLHQIEKQLRQEIRQEQVVHWTQAKIKAAQKSGYFDNLTKRAMKNTRLGLLAELAGDDE